MTQNPDAIEEMINKTVYVLLKLYCKDYYKKSQYTTDKPGENIYNIHHR